MPTWIRACATEDIELEDLIRFDHGSQTFVIVRSPEDEFFAMDGICSHEHVHLCDGLVMDGTLECPKHNAHFDYRNGEAMRAPACINLKTFPVKVEGGDVFYRGVNMGFQLAACAEMLWRDKPIDWRASRLKEMGFGVGLWNWPSWDLARLGKTGATFTIMNGYLEGRLTDSDGAAMLLASARETVQVGKRLGVQRLNLHGTGLGDMGVPIPQIGAFAPGMVNRARDTLHRICDLAESEDVVFTLENLNPLDHPGCPFGSTADVLALVSAVNRPQLRINLDLYHTQIGEGDLIRWCEACLPWIGEVQVADNPGRYEPGTGEINYAGVAKALASMGYDGAVGLESFAKGSEDAALEAFRNAFTV